MAKKDALSVYVALDRSGSMSGERWTHAIDSINEYIEGLKKEKIEGTVNVVAFDYGQSMRLIDLVNDQSIAYYEPLKHDCSAPSGMTPLYDAAANVMDRALENNAKRTVIVIMTDGEENSSKEFTQATIKAKVKDLTDRKWEVLFLGANFDVSRYTAGSGLATTKMRNVDFSNQWARTSMTADLTSNTIAYATVGAAMDMSKPAVEVNVNVKAN
jgi:Mg-chelatase subunit ChlD